MCVCLFIYVITHLYLYIYILDIEKSKKCNNDDDKHNNNNNNNIHMSLLSAPPHRTPGRPVLSLEPGSGADVSHVSPIGIPKKRYLKMYEV